MFLTFPITNLGGRDDIGSTMSICLRPYVWALSGRYEPLNLSVTKHCMVVHHHELQYYAK